jgi:hypothetical protein
MKSVKLPVSDVRINVTIVLPGISEEFDLTIAQAS